MALISEYELFLVCISALNLLNIHPTYFCIGLICLNDANNRRRHAELAREVWHKSLMELIRQMTSLFPPERPINLNSTSPDTMEYYRSLLERLKPGNLCESSDHVVWQWGRRLNK